MFGFGKELVNIIFIFNLVLMLQRLDYNVVNGIQLYIIFIRISINFINS